MKFHSLSDSRTQSTFFCLRRIIEYYRFFDVLSTRSLWLCSKDKGIASYLYALAGVWPTCGVVRLDYCLYLLLGRIPWRWTIGYVLLVGYFWLCQNSSIDPASGVSLRCSPSDPLFLFRFPRVSFKASICCLEEVPGVGLCGVSLLFGFLWLCHTSPVDAVWVWRL